LRTQAESRRFAPVSVFSSCAACKANSANFTLAGQGQQPLSVFGDFLLIQKVTQDVGQNAPQA